MPGKRPPHTRGTLGLVLIAAASGLPGCSDPVDSAPEQVVRARYDNVESCVQDWGDESQCEANFDPTGLDQGAASGAGTGHAARGGGGHFIWWGPYYSRAGNVYRYDGRVDQLARPPQNAAGFSESTMTPRQVFRSGGRYATTAAHPNAVSAKPGATGRGGFGGTGRGSSGGG